MTTVPDSISSYAYRESVIARFDAIRAHHHRDWRPSARRLINSLQYMLEHPLLKALDELLEIEPLQTRPLIVEVLIDYDWDTIVSLSAHREWMKSHPDEIADFASTMLLVKSSLNPTPDSNGFYPTLEAHAEMEKAYDQNFYRWTGTSYYQNEPVSNMVESDPTCVQDLIGYLHDHDVESFDAADFIEYRKHHAVKDGWL
jgi:hypothetical protein